MNCLYILGITPLSVYLFATIPSHSEGCLFIFFMVSFAMQKALKFNQVPFIYFCFYFHYSRRWIKKILLRFFFFLRYMLKTVLPMFSSESFVMSGLIFRSLIHFEFTFIYDVREYSNFILLYLAIQLS